jgi:hypothetical protein
VLQKLPFCSASNSSRSTQLAQKIKQHTKQKQQIKPTNTGKIMMNVENDDTSSRDTSNNAIRSGTPVAQHIE